jgi:hypothetical protein
MSDLDFFERMRLEELFGMGSGYVLRFSDKSFKDFFSGYEVDIDAERYKASGKSKANRLRAFWELEGNNVAGRVINGLIESATAFQAIGCGEPLDPSLIGECREIARRLIDIQPMVEFDPLAAMAGGPNFEAVTRQIRSAIENNQPEGGLDRLHTCFRMLLREWCEPHGVAFAGGKPLRGVFGEYVKALRKGKHLEPGMAELILRSNIPVLEKFNDLPNNQSLARGGKIMNKEESLLIFNHVMAIIRFINALEAKIRKAEEQRRRLHPGRIFLQSLKD